MDQKSLTKQTLLLYLRANLKYKKLFFSTLFSWSGGIFIQKIILPLIIATSFDYLISNGSKNVAFSDFTGKIILFALAAIASQALVDLGLVLLSKMETRVYENLHESLFKHLLYLDITFHNNNFSGALVNKVNRFVSGYVSITDNFVINITQLVILTLFSAMALAFYSPLLASVIFIWFVIFFYVNGRLTIQRIKYSKDRAAADSLVTASVADSVTNVSAIKAFANEKPELTRHHYYVHDRAKKGYIYWIKSIKNDAVFGLMMSFIQLLVLVLSVFLVINNQLTIGTLILAQVYMTQTIGSLWGLSGIAKTLEQNVSDAAEMTEILNRTTNVKDSDHPKRLDIKNPVVTFNNVTFTHSEENEALFENLSLQIRAGEKVGLVGRSGSGKTTLTKILLRFSDIDAGEIVIDAQNIAHVAQEDLRAAITYVPQEPLMFHRSIAENIRYGKPDATESEIEKIAKLANAHEFIKKLPKGYETLVGERGIKLSGGQRQRIAIARAMIKDAPILVLDEATSALDSESEVLIQDALWRLMEGKTAIVIAHRLSTIQHMDRILVLDDGKVVEEGTHSHLVKSKGVYSELWAHQSGGFLEE